LTDELEIRVTLRGLDGDDQAAFVDAVDFAGPTPTLVIGVRAIWDADAEQLDVTWGYPEHDWKRLARDARDRLAHIWMPADRDPSRLVAFIGSRSLLTRLIDALPLDQSIDGAVAAIAGALQVLVADPIMAQLLAELDSELGGLIPDVTAGAHDVSAAVTTPAELLAQFELALSHFGPPIAVRAQSSGLAQLAAFVVALRILAATPCIVLVDEPELSLHPQAQRSVAASIRNTARQSIVATHSSSVLSGADARNVIRLKHGVLGTEASRPAGLTADDATKLARYATPETAEAFFARTVVFVEGPSDYLTLRVVATTLGVDLDAKGVALVSLEGAGLLATYLRLLGPQGLGLELRGVCDLDAEQDWCSKLTHAGIAGDCPANCV